jgi:hypothetical protein
MTYGLLAALSWGISTLLAAVAAWSTPPGWSASQGAIR